MGSLVCGGEGGLIYLPGLCDVLLFWFLKFGYLLYGVWRLPAGTSTCLA